MYYVSPPIKTDKLLVYYDAANSKSYNVTGSVWYDLSGNNTNGTLINNPTFDKRIGGSFWFNSEDLDTINFQVDLRQDFSYECWAYHLILDKFGMLGQGEAGPDPNIGLHIWYATTSSIRFGMYANDTDFNVTNTATGSWYHYVFTYSNTAPYQKMAYRNGEPLTPIPQQTQAPYSGSGVVRIGAIYGTGGTYSYASGSFAMAKIYNKVLNQGEVLQNFNAMKTRFNLD